MLAVISPAKTLEFENIPPVPETTLPDLLPQSEYLIEKLKKLSVKKIGALMDISPKLAELNHQRFHEFHTPFNEKNAKPSIMVFKGDVYLGMKAEEFSEKELKYAQHHLRMLSGLYGLLRPFDLMQPYRLEMGTSFAVTAAKKNLYQYWGNTITEKLNEALEEAGTKTLLNLASQEYFKAVVPKKLKGNVVVCEFLDGKNGKHKVISFFAKKARGMMANYLIKNEVKSPADLRGFDAEGYIYAPKLSTKDQFIFTRDEK
ncbi:MAG: peroxide stress protein YaaA [Bacteroidota bacterium]